MLTLMRFQNPDDVCRDPQNDGGVDFAPLARQLLSFWDFEDPPQANVALHSPPLAVPTKSFPVSILRHPFAVVPFSGCTQCESGMETMEEGDSSPACPVGFGTILAKQITASRVLSEN